MATIRKNNVPTTAQTPAKPAQTPAKPAQTPAKPIQSALTEADNKPIFVGKKAALPQAAPTIPGDDKEADK